MPIKVVKITRNIANSYFLLSFFGQLWHELCDLISQNPDKVTSLNVGAIIRGGLTRFTDQLGKLWCSLADYYIRSGHFEKVFLLCIASEALTIFNIVYYKSVLSLFCLTIIDNNCLAVN